MTRQLFSALFAGAGPAGTGPLIYAAQQNQLQQLLDKQIAIVDQSNEMVRGTIGRYAIPSDTSASVFLECRSGINGPTFPELTNAPETAQIAHFGRGPVPLPYVGHFLARLGKALQQRVDQHASSTFYPHCTIDTIQCQANGLFSTACHHQHPHHHTNTQPILSRSVVLALGGYQDQAAILRDPIIPGLTLKAQPYQPKVIMSNWLLAQQDEKKLAQILARSTTPSAVIIGSSHSAFASASKLLNLFPRGIFQDRSIHILYRRQPKLFYPSASEAHTDGYTDFGPNDICPVTQRVYRLAGMRHDSKALLRQIWGMDPAQSEPRVTLTPLAQFGTPPQTLHQLLDHASIIIPAFGYRPRTPKLIDESGKPIDLLANHSGPLVDDRCRVLDQAGQPIPNLFGVGLASGFPIGGKLGGEPSFRGQSNGLWLYQNDIGRLILEQI